MIEASELKISNDSITLVIDSSGIYYRVPIACINDPVKYVESEEKKKIESKAKPAEIHFKCLKMRAAGENDVIISTSNWTGILDLKKLYLEKSKRDVALERVRFFCMGRELKDENCLYSYDV